MDRRLREIQKWLHLYLLDSAENKTNKHKTIRECKCDSSLKFARIATVISYTLVTTFLDHMSVPQTRH